MSVQPLIDHFVVSACEVGTAELGVWPMVVKDGQSLDFSFLRCFPDSVLFSEALEELGEPLRFVPPHHGPVLCERLLPSRLRAVTEGKTRELSQIVIACVFMGRQVTWLLQSCPQGLQISIPLRVFPRPFRRKQRHTVLQRHLGAFHL